MADETDEPIVHIEETDSRGRGTGYALCRGDGLLGVNNGRATCAICVAINNGDADAPGDGADDDD